jgi:hypothetical protein
LNEAGGRGALLPNLSHQTSVGQEVPQGIARIARLFVQPRQIEMRVGETGLEREGVPVDGHRLADPV